MSKATSPTSAEDIIVSSISKDASDLVEERQIVGRKIWRILPYVTRYWERALGGLLANIGARIFDLIPFIAIGMAADYYNCLLYTSPSPRDRTRSRMPSSA